MRNGFMALVIQISNLIEKHKEDEGVKEYLDDHEEAWSKFIESEVKPRNEINSK